MSPFADGQRDAAGRFRPGWRGGPGNPHARQVARLRAALLESATPERWASLVEMLWSLALDGDRWAMAQILDRTIGRPSVPDAPDPAPAEPNDERLRRAVEALDAAGLSERVPPVLRARLQPTPALPPPESSSPAGDPAGSKG